MKRDEALAILSQHQSELAAFGLRRLALFGSVARDEAGPESDVDVLVDFEGEPTFRRYTGLYDCLESLFHCSVDLVTESSVRPVLRPYIEEDAYDVQKLSSVS